MKRLITFFFVALPLLLACDKPTQKIVIPIPGKPTGQQGGNNGNNGSNGNNGNGGNTTPTPPTPPEDPAAILVTNEYVQKYLEEVTYKGIENEQTKILGYPGGGPGEADIPPTHTITWTADASAGTLNLHVQEGSWSRDYSLNAGAASQDMTNLVPGREFSQYTA